MSDEVKRTVKAMEAKYHWTESDVELVRNMEHISYMDIDFDNDYQIELLNKGAPYAERRYLVRRRTSGRLTESPTWFPSELK